MGETMKSISLAIFALCVASACSAPKARAAEPTQTTSTDALIKETIELRNVKPSVMAYWLDAARNNSPRNAIPLQVAPEIAVLPVGVEQLIPDDSTNTIVVRGTPDGVAKARRVIALMNVPIPQFKIEAQWLRFPKIFAPAAQMPNRSSNLEIETLDDKFIGYLVAQKEATILTAPHVTTFNRSLAQIASFTTREITESPKLDEKTRTIYAGNGVILSATPTLNRVGNIELKVDFLDGFVVCDVKEGAAKYANARPIPSDTNRTIQTAITIARDDKRFVALRNKKQDDPKNQYVLLIRATPQPLD